MGEKIMLQEVGKIISSAAQDDSKAHHNTNIKGIDCVNFPWPKCITGGDISADGQRIIVRNYEVSHMWMRHDGQSIEEAMIENESCEFPMRYEPLGESVAIK